MIILPYFFPLRAFFERSEIFHKLLECGAFLVAQIVSAIAFCFVDRHSCSCFHRCGWEVFQTSWDICSRPVSFHAKMGMLFRHVLWFVAELVRLNCYRTHLFCALFLSAMFFPLWKCFKHLLLGRSLCRLFVCYFSLSCSGRKWHIRMTHLCLTSEDWGTDLIYFHF